MRLLALIILLCVRHIFALRRTGLQGFVEGNILYLDGGLYLNENGNPAPSNRSIDHVDLNKDFVVGSPADGNGPTVFHSSKPTYVPDVSHGIIWSDYRNLAYLYGGAAVDGNKLTNSIWEVDTSNGSLSWTEVEVNLSEGRPSHGAGCDFYSIKKGFYLGGWMSTSGTNDSDTRTYRHTLDIWDMRSKTMKHTTVPEFVPIVQQSLVPVDNLDGKVLLVALGGYTHKNGTLTIFGGCYNDPAYNMSCASYSYDPLVYNIASASWSNYAYHALGYFVPPIVSNVIGGSEVGNAKYSSPVFTTFSSHRLSQLFTPPPHPARNGLEYSRPVKIAGLVCLLAVVPFIGWMIVDFVSVQDQQKKRWAISLPYLCFLWSTSAAILILVAVAYLESQKPDPDVSHWSGAPVSDGFWTGQAMESPFVNKPSPHRPPQGLLSVYYDQGTSGTYSQRNFTIRLRPIIYWSWNYLPLLIVVLYGRAWKMLDVSLKSVYKYSHLKPFGRPSA
ncbi:hypothetical protein DV736_g5257, partial [Chaetothyriales sp. CBS 134916]